MEKGFCRDFAKRTLVHLEDVEVYKKRLAENENVFKNTTEKDRFWMKTCNDCKVAHRSMSTSTTVFCEACKSWTCGREETSCFEASKWKCPSEDYYHCPKCKKQCDPCNKKIMSDMEKRFNDIMEKRLQAISSETPTPQETK